ncbi:MAG: hypothetical protein QXD23_01680, partial [Candidatus Micrarchaeaceae archaeon]
LLALSITKIRNTKNGLYKYKIFLSISYSFSFISMLILFLLISSNYGSNFSINKGSINNAFLLANNSITSFGIHNCDYISNDWVYLRYYKISAFSPYGYPIKTKNYSIIIFDNLGTSPNAISTQNNQILYKTQNFTIFSNKSEKC